MRSYDDNDTLVWRFINRSGRFSECFVRSTARGAEVEIRSNDATVITHRFEREVDAMAWAGEARVDFER